MALEISGKNYEISWDEEEQRWIGYVFVPREKKISKIRVFSDEEFEKVTFWILHHMDEMIEESKQNDER